jgi:hypothetical protein
MIRLVGEESRSATLAMALGLLACSCTRSAPSATDASVEAIDCEHAFSPPSGATQLCNENVMGNGAEIHWQSYATGEARAGVNDRYRALATHCKLTLAAPPDFGFSRGDTRLSTFEASQPGYPTCANKPSSSQNTVVVISTMTKR